MRNPGKPRGAGAFVIRTPGQRPARSLGIALLPIAVSALLACNVPHGTTSKLPPPGSREDSARIVILRDESYLGHMNTVGVRFDGYEIAYMRIGEFVELLVPPGRHVIDVYRSRRSLEFERGQSYYYVIAPISGFFGIERIDDPGEGETMIRRSRRLGPWRGEAP